MTYRPEIDGLRAIAVLAVILFHAGLPAFAGGYVGVDVFFVISGYLITTLILQDLAAGTFSFGRFYERRARRILPALILVLLACLPFAWAWMLPSQLADFAGSVFAAGVFLSNFYFLTQVEYFQPASELQPLLHTWSLAIEEQYYLLFPALMLALFRFGTRIIFAVLLAFVLGGLYLAHAGVTDDPSKNYFHTAARLWEIGAGALCALLPRLRRNDLLAALGLVAIAGAIFGFSDATPFPSLYAILPVGGTVLLVLFADGRAGLGRLLAHPAMVGTGLLSYSAYLWHQPIFAFYRLRALDAPGPLAIALMIAATFTLAWLSWRWVEMPFRRRFPAPLVPRRARYMLASMGLMAVLAAAGLGGYLAQGWPERSRNGIALAELDHRLRPNTGLADTCADGYSDGPDCRTAQDWDLLLWGDSFAMHLAPGLLAADPGLRLRQQTRSGCAPLLGVAFRAPGLGVEGAAPCQEFNRRVLADLEAATRPRTVVVSSPLPIHAQTVWDTARGTPVDDPAPRVAAALRDTLDRIRAAGHRPVLAWPPPEGPRDLGLCASKVLRFGMANDACDFARSRAVNAGVYAILQGLDQDLARIRIDTALCPGGVCDTIREGAIMYRDAGHLSVEGARALAPAFAPALAR